MGIRVAEPEDRVVSSNCMAKSNRIISLKDGENIYITTIFSVGLHNICLFWVTITYPRVPCFLILPKSEEINVFHGYKDNTQCKTTDRVRINN